jgi:glycosyltransferase involved in cell wall biosynthesis
VTGSTRILHIVPTLFDDHGEIAGGAERYAFELARHMAKEVPTSLISFGKRDRRETAGQLELLVIGDPWHVRRQEFNPVSAAVLPELRKADVVHCHQQHIMMSSVSALACRAMGRRVFVSDLGGGGWDVSAYFSTDRWYHGHLHISQYSRKVFGHHAKTWAHVIFGGVDTEKFSPDSSVPTTGTVVFAGRLLPHKGVDDLIKAVPPDMPLEIIGKPLHMRYLEDLQHLAQGKRVAFRHDCDDAALVRAYRQALCVVLPSVYRTMYGETTNVPELLGQTLLEGMACGAPVICTNVASMPEIVADGVTGFIVPPNDPVSLGAKLVWLREHPEEARKMGDAARKWVLEKFTWPAVVHRCLEIYGATG